MSQKSTIAEVIEITQERFNQIAPQHINYAAEKGFAIQLLKNDSRLFAAANKCPESLQQAITNVAAIALTLNPAEKLAYLITRSVKTGKKDDQGKDIYETRVFLEPSYMGLTRLATNTGSIKWAQARVVYSNDKFIDNGIDKAPTHECDPFATREQRGEFRGVYCVAKTKDDDYLTTMLSAERVYEIRGRSEAWKAGKFGPWKTDFEEQAKKSAVRNAHKMWPKSDEHENERRLALAVHLSNQNEGYEQILTAPEIQQSTDDQKTYFDQLIEKSDALGMYVFMETIESGVRANLYNSFEKGKKGQYKKIVDELYQKGFGTIQDYITIFQDGARDGDDFLIKENLSELTEDALTLILGRLDNETRMIVESLYGGNDEAEAV